jgi:molybdopterin-guanine dinucleotide biosynthesis protein A
MLTVVLQAGGASRRMGQDKGLIPFLGKPLIERLIQRLAPVSQEMIINTNQPTHYAYLGLPTVEDVIPNRGALGGLYTAIHASIYPLVAVIACDMPFASPELLSAERDILLADPAIDAVIPHTEGGNEPFHSIYRREACLPLVEAAINTDMWRVDSWFSLANIRYMEPPETWRYDPEGLAFLNLNTPEDLLRAEDLARALETPHPNTP